MGLPGLIIGLPLLPVRALAGLAQLVLDEAWRELRDPAAIRHQLEEIAEARAAGLLSDQQAAALEHEAISRLLEE